MKIALVILSFVLIVGCKNTQQSKSNDQIVLSQEGSNWKKVENETGTYTLYYQDIDDVQNPKLKKDFYISDASGKRVFENSIYGGYVKWYDATKIEFFSPPGVMPPDKEKDDLVLIYDLVEKQSYSKSKLSQ